MGKSKFADCPAGSSLKMATLYTTIYCRFSDTFQAMMDMQISINYI